MRGCGAREGRKMRNSGSRAGVRLVIGSPRHRERSLSEPRVSPGGPLLRSAAGENPPVSASSQGWDAVDRYSARRSLAPRSLKLSTAQGARLPTREDLFPCCFVEPLAAVLAAQVRPHA